MEKVLSEEAPMPTEPADTRAAFIAAMCELRANFASAAADIDERELILEQALAELRYILSNGIGQSVLAPSHPLARSMSSFDRELATIVQDWLDRVEKHNRNTAFRKGLTDSFVVFVLGKVKAGKSSLGNYMAYGSSNPDGLPQNGLSPHFFTAAIAQGTADQAEAATGPGGFFRVGARETTKSIQGFRIPGLTWVDSPGLHSVTRESGALASNYADVADLIIYPMNSSAPARTGDLAEIQGLVSAKSPFLVVITQCDKHEEDEAPDGTIFQKLVMKDRASRQGQIDHVRRAVASPGDGVQLDVLSLSVRFAETHGNTPAALEESGLADFFRLLIRIARSEGVKYKCKTPSRNLDHFVNLVLGADESGRTLSVALVHQRLRELDASLVAATAELDRRGDQVTAAVFGQINPLIARLVERHAGDKNQEDFERECTDALREIVAEETRTGISSLLGANDASLMSVASCTEISGFESFKSITVGIPKSNRNTIGAGGKAMGGLAGFWGGTEVGAVAGSVILPGFGSMIGAAIGGMIGALGGGAAGNAVGRAFGSDWEEAMQSGDNRADVEASAIKALQNAGRDAVGRFFEGLQNAAIKPVKQRIARLDHELERFSDILKRKVHSNGRSVPPRV